MRQSFSPNALQPEDLRTKILAFDSAIRSRPVTATSILPVFEPYLETSAYRAATAITKYIDERPAGQSREYHNLTHYLNVAFAVLCVTRFELEAPSHFFKQSNQSFSREDVAVCVIAALIHDLDHPGGSNGKDAFRLENQSWATAAPLLKRAGYEDDRLRIMLLATDPMSGVYVVEKMMRAQLSDHMHRMTYVKDVVRYAGRREKGELHDLVRALRASSKLTAMCYILNKCDIALALMPETFEQTVKDLNAEYITARVKVRLVHKNGALNQSRLQSFARHIAHVDAHGFLLESVEAILGPAARKTYFSHERKPDKPVGSKHIYNRKPSL